MLKELDINNFCSCHCSWKKKDMVWFP